ncbi:unnamed protein product [Eruca vesicaria subsp. sativa]|uniref:Stigma-specific STIG1-like protein 1 n=1 Tax=Eruca vesicaria subsp. sativa TaxID=29727 RepID=A0ABC8KXV4_ERUVS|nr:unnamed protein product [Eruca vesicaria subsp. sativa]
MAQFMKLLVTIALTFAITTAIITTTTTTTNTTTKTVALEDPLKGLTPPGAIKIRRSRFLAEKTGQGQRAKARNLQEAASCKPEICRSTEANSTMACCSKKCVNLSTDRNNCGVCKRKCRSWEKCCGGWCESMIYNDRHCGACNHRCKPGHKCALALCNYA